MQLIKIIFIVGMAVILHACGGSGGGDSDRKEEPHPNQDLAIDEIKPGPDNSGIPFDRWDEYQQYVEQTTHLRTPHGNVYKISVVSDAGEDLHYLTVDADGRVTALNYLGDTVDGGSDCYRVAQGDEPNALLTGSMIVQYDYTFERGVSDYGFVLPSEGVDGSAASITWHQNDYGFLSAISINAGAGDNAHQELRFDEPQSETLQHEWLAGEQTIRVAIPLMPDESITLNDIEQYQCANQAAGLYVTDWVNAESGETFYEGFLHIDATYHMTSFAYSSLMNCYEKNPAGINEYLAGKTLQFDGLANQLFIETPSVPDTPRIARFAFNLSDEGAIESMQYTEFETVDNDVVERVNFTVGEVLHTVMLLPEWGEIRVSKQKSSIPLSDVQNMQCDTQ